MGSITKKKIWTAIVMVPPLILLVVLGTPDVLTSIVLLATFLGLCEFYNLTLPHSNKIERWVGIGMGLILSVIISHGDLNIVFPFLVLLLLILFLVFMGTLENFASTVSRMGIVFFGIFYIAFLISYISLIRKMPDGKQWTLFLIATVWGGDICALLSGSIFGKHKLFPKISPNKTYEGLTGAIAGSILVAISFALLFNPPLKKGFFVLLGVGLGVLGQLGDFTESMFKRSAKVKDSGNLIPGHGGMLDRLDSFLFSAPFIYYFLLFISKETP